MIVKSLNEFLNGRVSQTIFFTPVTRDQNKKASLKIKFILML